MPVRPELLAPVGNWEALVAAVENGADAVYLGGKQFSARQYANNFDEEEMKKALDYAHLRGVRVFVTVNTLLASHELEQCLEYLRFLYDAGVDAVIVQDLGVVRLVKKLLPGLELHASTQMTVHNLAGVRLLEDLGFNRVVLSREVSLENIRHIKNNCRAELEVFVHGALCVSYSGQCLMSSLIGGRSGNRGRCAQPCRLKYNLVGEKGETLSGEDVGMHLLSPRDLNLVEHLPQLIEAGVKSFKVEGRMKRPEYVATVIRVYREALNRYFLNRDYEIPTEDMKNLAQIFNRDFTTGYLYGNEGRNLMSFKRPNNRGLRLGRIEKFNPKTREALISLDDSLQVGDGLEVWVSQGGRQGVIVSSISVNGRQVEVARAGKKVTIPIPGKVRQGDRVFKTLDAALMNRARSTFINVKEGRRVPVKVEVRVAMGQPLTITVSDQDGNRGEGRTVFLAEAALRRPLTEETIRSQVNRLGNTPFTLQEFSCTIEGELMVPVSEINEARRQAVEQLEQQRLSRFRQQPMYPGLWQRDLELVQQELKVQEGNPGVGRKAELLLTVAVSDLASVESAAGKGAQVIYFGGESFRSKEPIKTDTIVQALDVCHRWGAELVLSTPRILQDDELEAYLPWLEKVARLPVNGLLIGNLGLLKIAIDNFKLPIYGDYGLNIFNNSTVLALRELGVKRWTLSPELTLEQVGQLAALADGEAIVHGSLTMMVSEYCAPGAILGGRERQQACQAPCRKGSFGLRDRMNFVFPVETDQYCHMHVFNPKELCLIDDLPVLAGLGLKAVRLELKRSEARYVSRVVGAYRQELAKIKKNGPGYQVPAGIREQLENMSPAGFTKGHYYRGVI